LRQFFETAHKEHDNSVTKWTAMYV
jgi:hypothetical protein